MLVDYEIDSIEFGSTISYKHTLQVAIYLYNHAQFNAATKTHFKIVFTILFIFFFQFWKKILVHSYYVVLICNLSIIF